MKRTWGMMALGLLAGCAHHHRRPPTSLPIPAAPQPEPQPPLGAAAGLPIPDPDGDSRFATIDSGLGEQETIWHLRAALNVAALSCRNDPGIATRYNALLTARKPMLAVAYTAETKRFADAGALDRHMTQLYNFFAQPPAQSGFCRAAAAEAPRAAEQPVAGFAAYAGPALARLEAPILDFYRAYARYRIELAAWRANPAARQASAAPPARAVQVAEATQPTAASWRIQLGAFTGQAAAEAAWVQAKARVPGLARYRPHYEGVPDRPALVRLQIGSADDRAGALRLCATAAAGGFDCLPVAR